MSSKRTVDDMLDQNLQVARANSNNSNVSNQVDNKDNTIDNEQSKARTKGILSDKRSRLSSEEQISKSIPHRGNDEKINIGNKNEEKDQISTANSEMSNKNEKKTENKNEQRNLSKDVADNNPKEQPNENEIAESENDDECSYIEVEVSDDDDTFHIDI